MKMNKNLILSALAAGMIISSATVMAAEKNDLELTNKLQDLVVEIDGDLFKLDECLLSDFFEAGWALDESYYGSNTFDVEKELLKAETKMSLHLAKDEDTLDMFICNYDKNAIPMLDSRIASLSINTEEIRKFAMGEDGCITLDSSREDIKNCFGNPDDEEYDRLKYNLEGDLGFGSITVFFFYNDNVFFDYNVF